MPVVTSYLLRYICYFHYKNKHAEPRGTVTYFLLKSTVKDENEHSLESIKDGEEICHHYSLLINKKQPKWPG